MRAFRIAQYVLFGILDLLVTLIALVFFNWWLPFIAVKSPRFVGYQDLPGFFRWFGTFDASLDEGWAGGYFATHYPLDTYPPYWTRKAYQIRWLYRNPSYGFSYYALGTAFDPKAWTATYSKIGNVERFTAVSTNGHFNWMYTGPLGTYKLGWKAWNYFDPTNNEWRNTPYGPSMTAPEVTSINPFRKGT